MIQGQAELVLTITHVGCESIEINGVGADGKYTSQQLSE
jgi:hypothetical protein